MARYAATKTVDATFNAWWKKFGNTPKTI